MKLKVTGYEWLTANFRASESFAQLKDHFLNHGWLRYTRMGKTKSTGLIHCANAESVVEKTLASPLADAFSQHIPAWRPSATQYFSKKSLSTAQTAPVGLPKGSPALLPPSV